MIDPSPFQSIPHSASWTALPTRTLGLGARELVLEHTLNCGQAFRWRRDGAGWSGVIGRRVVHLSEMDDGRVTWRAFPEDVGAEDDIARYLRLDVDLNEVQRQLRAIDRRVGEAIDAFPGLRVLGQDSEETLFTFVCSPASNIVRITRSIDLLCRQYGEPLARIGEETYYAFPKPTRLASTAVGELARQAGLGFRGENLRRIATLIEQSPAAWLEDLIASDYQTARAALQELPAIGPKIADCICLFGLRHDAAVPVDTHVWALARELFDDASLPTTLTPRAYDQVLGAYLDRYGEWAGWAQQYLYHGRRVNRTLPMPSDVTLHRA